MVEIKASSTLCFHDPTEVVIKFKHQKESLINLK